MSQCAVHMQKMKMSAVVGMQSHNQREHESRKNPDIDYSKSSENFDTVNDRPISYYREIKSRIEELNLPKAIRKDAVVYCSFIVSSDRAFFDLMAEQEHTRRENASSESVALGLREPTPLEYMPEEYQRDCVRAGAEKFFRKATDFFRERYGEANVINGSVHLDEATPHMHLGLVPVTPDGRLSAKDLFTPKELRELQTAFAEEVGADFGLERGKEGSKNKHLAEQEFKIKKAEETLEDLNEQIGEAKGKQFSAEIKAKEATAERNAVEAQKEALRGEFEALRGQVDGLREQKALLQNEKSDLQVEITGLQEQVKVINTAIKKKTEEAERSMGRGAWGITMAEAQKEIAKEKELDKLREKASLLDKFLEFPGVREIFQRFMQWRNQQEQERRKAKPKSLDDGPGPR